MATETTALATSTVTMANPDAWRVIVSEVRLLYQIYAIVTNLNTDASAHPRIHFHEGNG